MSDKQKTDSTKNLEKIVLALSKIDNQINQSAFMAAESMSEIEIIQSFNQETRDLFTIMLNITCKIGEERKYKVGAYKSLFDNAVKINSKMPIDKFTLIVLRFAPDIYEHNEESFLTMTIPDAKVEVGNEFNFIRSEMFKSLWKILNQNDQNIIKEKIVSLTTYAHIYFYKTILNQNAKT